MTDKHQNYEILNLIGYGLAKFDKKFIASFGFGTKTAFCEYLVQGGIAETAAVVKNRQDLFDPFFDNARKGWWQKGDTYIHRKISIDSLFGSLDANTYADIVKLYIQDNFSVASDPYREISPLIKSKFRQLQMTGRAAELYFMHHYKKADPFKDGILEDARLFGDGYDFQIGVQEHFFLAEIKGLQDVGGSVRMTKNEFQKAEEYKSDYALVVIYNLSALPAMSIVFNPADTLNFTEKSNETKQISYHTNEHKWSDRGMVI